LDPRDVGFQLLSGRLIWSGEMTLGRARPLAVTRQPVAP